jgi:hypothetical protein
MSILDRGLGIKLLTLRDLLDEEPVETALEGATVQPSTYRQRVKRFEDSGRIIDTPHAGISPIKYWIVLDCGEEKHDRRRPLWHGSRYDADSLYRKDRYLPVGVSVDQEIIDVEREESGKALPGIYYSWDEACEVSSDLCAVCHIHED